MPSRPWALARHTLLEYRRGRTLASLLLVLVIALAIVQGLDGLALTETTAVQATLAGAWMRLALVVLLASSVIVSHAREHLDRSLDWILATGLPRSHWLAGRLAGHLILAALLAISAALVLAWPAGWLAAASWALQLALELAVCACMATFLAATLAQVPQALLVFLGWYTLARSMAALQLLVAMPLLDDGSAYPRLLGHALAALGWLLPRLDLYARGDLLAGKAGLPVQVSTAALALQAGAYGALLVAAALADLRRREW